MDRLPGVYFHRLGVPTLSKVVVHANQGANRAQRRAAGNRRPGISLNTPFVGKVRDRDERS